MGILANLIVIVYTLYASRPPKLCVFCPVFSYFDWPVRTMIDGFNTNPWQLTVPVNLVFWILVALIVLSLARYFRNKNPSAKIS